MINIILQIAGGFIAVLIGMAFLLFVADWFVCKYKKLYLYGYYTNGIGVFQLIQYDKVQVTIYDIKEDRMIIIGRSEFIHDFEFVMSDTVKFKGCLGA